MVSQAGHIIDFSELVTGMKARVASIRPDWAGEVRVLEMGLTQGAEFEVIKVAPLGDPIEICLRGYRLCLRKAEIKGVKVEVLEEAP